MSKGLKWAVLAFAVISCAAVGQQDSEKVYKVSGWGGYPISANLMSMWLAAPSGQPLVMVYLHGPEGWHNAEWKFSSKFEKGMPGWAELTSEKAKLRIWLDADSGQAQVQSQKVSVREANTYLVLHVVDAKRQKVVPMGLLDLPRSTGEPASVLLIRGNPELVEKMKKVIADAAGG